MPSPFPGMDPYLEGDDWTSFHTHLASEITRQLTPLLRPKYVALPEKRFDVIAEGALAIESIYLDVGVAGIVSSASDSTGPTLSTAPYLLQTIMEDRAPHTWIEIRDRAERRLVTTIEILSPWNKRGSGRDEPCRPAPITITSSSAARKRAPSPWSRSGRSHCQIRCPSFPYRFSQATPTFFSTCRRQ